MNAKNDFIREWLIHFINLISCSTASNVPMKFKRMFFCDYLGRNKINSESSAQRMFDFCANKRDRELLELQSKSIELKLAVKRRWGESKNNYRLFATHAVKYFFRAPPSASFLGSRFNWMFWLNRPLKWTKLNDLLILSVLRVFKFGYSIREIGSCLLPRKLFFRVTVQTHRWMENRCPWSNNLNGRTRTSSTRE